MGEEGCKVLVLHEDRGYAVLFELILARHRNDSVVFASGGYQGLAMAEKDQPDLIFIYLWMPGLPAFEFFDRVRKTPGLESIPVLFYGALDPEKAYPMMRRLGAAGYLYQPFKPQELIQARDAVLSGGTYYPEAA
jgi:DNA-binding response OmpR family regulator